MLTVSNAGGGGGVVIRNTSPEGGPEHASVPHTAATNADKAESLRGQDFVMGKSPEETARDCRSVRRTRGLRTRRSEDPSDSSRRSDRADRTPCSRPCRRLGRSCAGQPECFESRRPSKRGCWPPP